MINSKNMIHKGGGGRIILIDLEKSYCINIVLI